MVVLVTGGAGYIGSHTVLALQRAAHEVIVVDNCANSSPVALDRVQQLSGSALMFHETDLRDTRGLSRVFDERAIDVVIHFEGLKAVGESVAHPLRYYHNNIAATVSLCTVMDQHDIRKIVPARSHQHRQRLAGIAFALLQSRRSRPIRAHR